MNFCREKKFEKYVDTEGEKGIQKSSENAYLRVPGRKSLGGLTETGAGTVHGSALKLWAHKNPQRSSTSGMGNLIEGLAGLFCSRCL